MLTKAYEAQCRATKLSSPAQERRRGFALFALALGSFVIGTSEFASMGILQIFSADLHITVPVATHAITGYALGVLLGAPIVTLAAAHLNRRTLLLGLMSLFIIANLLSAVATGIGMLAVARFISGLPQGAYFGAGAVVAAYFFGPSQGRPRFRAGHDGTHGRDHFRRANCDLRRPAPRLARYLHIGCRPGRTRSRGAVDVGPADR
jgi:MFS transporter, DHA1 family, inner membrane transport protein